VFKELSSKRWLIVAKSRVNPAKMLILRSFPRTSERITVSPSAGAEKEGDSFAGGGIAGPRFRFLSAIGFWFWLNTVTARDAVNRE